MRKYCNKYVIQNRYGDFLLDIITLFNVRFFGGRRVNGWAGLYYALVVRTSIFGYNLKRLLKHEHTHTVRMKEEGYWRWTRRYLADADFRGAEEVIAKAAEAVGE